MSGSGELVYGLAALAIPFLFGVVIGRGIRPTAPAAGTGSFEEELGRTLIECSRRLRAQGRFTGRGMQQSVSYDGIRINDDDATFTLQLTRSEDA